MDILQGLAPILILFAVFYLFFILPQQREAKRRQAMLDAVKTGDEVETVSRVFGTVDSVTDDKVVLKIGVGHNDSTKILIHRDGIARVITNEESTDSTKK